MQNYFLEWKQRFVGYNSESVLGAGWLWGSLGLEMTTLKQCLFLMVSGNAWPWRHPWVLWFHTYNYCQANDSCMSMDHQNPHGSLLHIMSLSCYNVSPNHTHKQDTITDTQCGRPFVWFMGDVVANVASVSFRGSGKLQIFPSQQEVQTWKKGREKRRVMRSWQVLEGSRDLWRIDCLPHGKTQMKLPVLQRRHHPAFKGVGEISSGRNVVKTKAPH